jgi:acyl carrier protein
MSRSSQSVEEVVTEVIKDILGRNGPQFTLSDDLVKDLKIDSDDLSFLFIPQLERRLNIEIPAKEWLTVGTGSGVCALLRKYLDRPKEDPRGTSSMNRTSVLWAAFAIVALLGQSVGWFPHAFDVVHPILVRVLIFVAQAFVGILIIARDRRLPVILVCLVGFFVGEWFVVRDLTVFSIWSIFGFAP